MPLTFYVTRKGIGCRIGSNFSTGKSIIVWREGRRRGEKMCCWFNNVYTPDKLRTSRGTSYFSFKGFLLGQKKSVFDPQFTYSRFLPFSTLRWAPYSYQSESGNYWTGNSQMSSQLLFSRPVSFLPFHSTCVWIWKCYSVSKNLLGNVDPILLLNSRNLISRISRNWVYWEFWEIGTWSYKISFCNEYRCRISLLLLSQYEHDRDPLISIMIPRFRFTTIWWRFYSLMKETSNNADYFQR